MTKTREGTNWNSTEKVQAMSHRGLSAGLVAIDSWPSARGVRRGKPRRSSRSRQQRCCCSM